MNILFIGDVVGKVGRNEVINRLSYLKNKYSIDFVIANLENATHGKGLSLGHYRTMTEAGINCVTMGNHYYRVADVLTKNEEFVNMIRPGNIHTSTPGVGTKVFTVKDKTIRVTNLIGKVFIDMADTNPFDYLNNIIEKEDKTDIHIVDFHAEATGEKMCLAKAFDGKLTAVLGTHTHVQTNDARILPLGTGFMSDVGMCGLYESILGVEPKEVINRTWKGIPGKFVTPESGRGQLNAAILEIDDTTNKLTKISPLYLIDD